MTAVALGLAVVLTGFAAALRFGGASLVRTHRADALRDAAEHHRGAAIVAELLDEPVTIQPSLGMVHAALLVSAAIPAAWALSSIASGWLLAVALVALGIALVLLGDTLPRSFGRATPRGPAYRLAPLLAAAVAMGRRAADFIYDEDDDDGSDDADEDADDAEQIELISSVLEFTDAIVREVMVPRTDMITISASEDTDRALDLVIARGRSRIPVTGDDLDDIVGVLYARDLLTLFDAGEGPRPVTRLMRPVHLIPETKRVSELLRELQASKVHLAVVVDEFGGTAGLVSIEDLLEEIVGEIVDEYDVEQPMVELLSDGEYLVDARMAVGDLGDLVGHEIPDDDWDTVGGLVLGLAGRVPEEGESFDIDHLVLTADRVQGRRVSRVRVSVR
ncbi:MAG TPA: hemolysin family protein [Acidimicrobiia bacterium]|nr:hemolysin family protein [Acidimicrobiia bacterium]